MNTMTMLNPLAISFPQGAEWLVIAAIGLLIFGKRLPEVGKGIGEAIRNFKKGLNSSDNDADQWEAQPSARQLEEEAKKEAPKFDPYTGKPLEAPAEAAHA